MAKLSEVGQTTSSTHDSPEISWILRGKGVADFKIEFEVVLANGDRKQLSEREVQATRPDLVFLYWECLGGRCTATGFDQYHIFRILNHRLLSSGRQYLVQWVGYHQGDSTWVSAGKVNMMSLELTREYDEDNGLV
ncbi:hypothetical protein ACHAPA_011909 [Fusarium lateritium]